MNIHGLEQIVFYDHVTPVFRLYIKLFTYLRYVHSVLEELSYLLNLLLA